MSAEQRSHDWDDQRGAALIVSMVMLVVITLIGVIAMNGSHLEWLMTNNSQFQSSAYHNATIALAAGLTDPTIPSSYPNPLPALSALSPSDLSNVTKWSDGTLTPTPVSSPACTVLCEYIVEYLGCSVFDGTPAPSTNACNNGSDTSIHSYRVWAYGSDGKGAARILQITVRRVMTSSGSPSIMKPPLLNNWVEIP